jgi:hypothetical protein
MKATINVSPNNEGGFEWYSWTLVVDFKDGLVKHFYLGQDTKFCYRVLCCQPSHVMREIGGGELYDEALRKKLAKFIIKELGLNAKRLRTLERWSLACQ